MFTAPSRAYPAIAINLILIVAPAMSQEWLAGPWSLGLFGPPGTDQPVVGMVDWDNDGLAATPPLLVVAGDFFHAGGESAVGLALWQRRRWQPLPPGFDNFGQINAVAVLTPGPGVPQTLVAGGGFGVLAYAPGVGWLPFPAPGGPVAYVKRLFVSPAFGGLYAAEDSPPVCCGTNIWYWSGTAWTLVGVASGGSGHVTAMSEYNGSLVVAGSFTTINGVSTPEIAMLTPGGWVWPGAVFANTPQALEVFDGELYAGGFFPIQKFDGVVWSEVPGGAASVRALLAYPPAAPTMLIASNDTGLGGDSVLAFDGVSWTGVGSGFTNGTVSCLAVHADQFNRSNAPLTVDTFELIAGGSFGNATQNIPSAYFGRIARLSFDDGVWRALGGGVESSIATMAGTNPVPAAFWPNVDPIAGIPVLYAGGTFERAGGLVVNNVARWKLNQWEPMGAGSDGSVSSMVMHNDGIGWRLYAAGSFTHMGGAAASKIARWDESAQTWSPVGVGLSGFAAPIRLAVFDVGDGLGPNLYAAGFNGEFARWNGTAWILLPPIPGFPADHHLQVVGAGIGQKMLTNADASPAIAVQWTGAAWSPLGAVTSGGAANIVNAFNPDSASPCLVYAGGSILQDGLALDRFNGSKWTDPGHPLIGIVSDIVTATAPASLMFVAGYLNVLGGGWNIAVWNGLVWDNLATGLLDGPVQTMTIFNDKIVLPGVSARYNLYAAGGIETAAFSYASLGIARANMGPSLAPSTCVPSLLPCTADVDGDGVIDLVDLTLILSQFGASGPLSGDLNHDGSVGITDLALLLSQFGRIC